MRRIAKLKKQRLCALTAAIVASAWMPTAMAESELDTRLPAGENIYKETASVTNNGMQNGKEQMTVEVKGARGAIDWNTFNIGKDARVNFTGDKGFMVLNRVKEGNPSEINGELNGRGGTVFLINPSGITFGKGASVDVGSLVASTLDTDKDKFLDVNNNTLNFTSKNGARITNLGNIKASDDGVVALLAHQVVSGGEIATDSNGVFVSATALETPNEIKAGQVAMAAGKNIKLELQYDEKIGVRLNTSVDNNGLTVITEKPGND